MSVVESKVKLDSPCIAFAPVTVHTVLFVEPDNDVPAVIPVNAEPSNAGRAPLKLDDGTVPLNDVAVQTPVILKPPVAVTAPFAFLFVI